MQETGTRKYGQTDRTSLIPLLTLIQNICTYILNGRYIYRYIYVYTLSEMSPKVPCNLLAKVNIAYVKANMNYIRVKENLYSNQIAREMIYNMYIHRIECLNRLGY